ncbi:MAG TPA: HNH endonuclease [Herpetosiphonaceae bacterium]|nr:HNH endonuclease [Herpetosiphonaceae bacterium]
MTWDTAADKTAARQYRRARCYGVAGDFDGWEWDLIRAWWGGRCLACGIESVTVEHVIPLSRGGSNNVVNLQVLCRACNSRKGTSLVDYREPAALVQLLELL